MIVTHRSVVVSVPIHVQNEGEADTMLSSSSLPHFVTGYLTPWLIVGEVMILVTCLIGDKLLEQAPYNFTGAAWAKAISDSLAHGFVGFFSWLVVRAEMSPQPIVEMVMCMLMAMAVDSDHFIAAGSFNIHDATSLSHRPPFHNSSLIILGTLLLLVLSQTWPSPHSTLMTHIPVIFAIAWTSHHIRDATRRGLWLWPIGSTRPLPRFVYIGCTMLLPLLTRLVLRLVPDAVPLKLKSSGSGIFNV